MVFNLVLLGPKVLKFTVITRISKNPFQNIKFPAQSPFQIPNLIVFSIFHTVWYVFSNSNSTIRYIKSGAQKVMLIPNLRIPALFAPLIVTCSALKYFSYFFKIYFQNHLQFSTQHFNIKPKLYLI